MNRDLAYPRAMLGIMVQDLSRDILRVPNFKDEGQERIAACELAIKILELYENYDSIEFGEAAAAVNGA